MISQGASILDRDGSRASVLSQAKDLLEILEDTRIYCHTPNFSNGRAAAEAKVITNRNGNIVLNERQHRSAMRSLARCQTGCGLGGRSRDSGSMVLASCSLQCLLNAQSA